MLLTEPKDVPYKFLSDSGGKISYATSKIKLIFKVEQDKQYFNHNRTFTGSQHSGQY